MRLTFILFLAVIAYGLQAQTYVDIPWRAGTIKKAGIEETGMIRLGGDLNAPWLNNTKVYFVPQQDFVVGKYPKNKVILEYGPEDIEGYSTYTEDKAGQRIEMNFTTKEILLDKGLSKKNTKVFLLESEKGSVHVYSFTPIPDDGTAASYDYAINHSTTYFQKGNGELTSAVACDMATLLNECPEVVSKIKSGAYGFTDLSERSKKKGLGKIMADSAGDNQLEMNLIKAVIEYNKCIYPTSK